MKDSESLEQVGGGKEPDLDMIVDEIEQAAVDMSIYLQRVNRNKRWWQCEWDNQWDDGRIHVDPRNKKKECWPWEGASDSRLRIVGTIVKEHTTLDLIAFWSAKVQVQSTRPFVEGPQVNVAQKMLEWRVYTQMKRELQSELKFAYNWKHANGLAFLGIEWEQQRSISYVPIDVPTMQQVFQQLGLGDSVGMLTDPTNDYDKELIQVLRNIAPGLDYPEARKILTELRETGQSQLPVVGLRINKPKWTAKRAGIDLLFPSETSDFQRGRWCADRELVDEVELTDRIATDGYDPKFVKEALLHKGCFAAFMPMERWDWHDNPGFEPVGSDRNLVELYHFYMRYLHNGVPCMYKTTFCMAAIGNDNLYAKHAKFEYEHGQFPFVALRRTHDFRPILTSIGIAEEAYTDEMDIKRQQDGLNNRTDLIHRPPKILPTLRAQAFAETYGPGGTMTAMRPESVVFPPLPPLDETPVIVMQMVQMRLDRRYAIIGGAVDPEIKAARRQQLATDNLGEMESVLEQTFQLQQQYETDEDVQRVAGGQEWNFSTKDIQGQYEMSATINMQMIDLNYKEVQLDALMKLMPFKDAGGKVFSYAAGILDPDLADALVQDQMSPAAMDRERKDEFNAVNQILGSGIEPDKPMMANNQFRLQTIQQIVSQPQVAARLGQDQVAQKLLQNRIEFFQNQIQQYQINPQIGRALSTTTFGNGAPAVTNQPATGY